MTDKEYKEKYPIGTAIIYRPDVNIVDYDAVKDAGKKGVIIGYSESKVQIYLPTSNNQKEAYGNSLRKQVTWRCRWGHIAPAIKKGQQLLFAFMEE